MGSPGASLVVSAGTDVAAALTMFPAGQKILCKSGTSGTSKISKMQKWHRWATYKVLHEYGLLHIIFDGMPWVFFQDTSRFDHDFPAPRPRSMFQ